MSKNILIFSDGTGKDGGVGISTNVYKLFNMVLDRDEEKQIAYYDPGIGTHFTSNLFWQKLYIMDSIKVTGLPIKIKAFIEIFFKIKSNFIYLIYYVISFIKNLYFKISGDGLDENVKDCYHFIFENYNSNDKIFLFGFSRGAGTVRRLSRFIEIFGILPKSRPELIDYAFSIYKIKNKNEREIEVNKFLKLHHCMKVEIELLGCWDTVVALQETYKSNFFSDLNLSSKVKNARHALAIDEKRKEFSPTLFCEKILPNQTMKQVWFRGTHSDIGGGYLDSGLSDISLQWMINESIPLGLLIYPKHNVKIRPNYQGQINESLKFFYHEENRSKYLNLKNQSNIHESVVLREEVLKDLPSWFDLKSFSVEKNNIVYLKKVS